MAFIGKMVHESKNKKPLVQFTFNPNINRISFIFRKGLIAADALIDVLIGTEEDAGYIKIEKGKGTPVSPIGKTGATTSWGACRSVAATVLPAMRRETAKIIQDTPEYLLLQVPLEVAEPVVAVAAPVAPVNAAAELGL